MILNLILYNDTPIYSQMRDILRKYLANTNNVKYYFYCYKCIDTEYLFEDDMLYIRGQETFVPGILSKTINAMEICQNFDFEYLVRSNISTVVNFDMLKEYLKITKIDYGGSLVTLDWLDFAGGITDDRYKYTKYVFGASIIMSRNSVKILLSNKNDIDYSVIDDVSLGLFFGKNNIKIHDLEPFFVYNVQSYSNFAFFYRNKRETREIDVECMKKITTLPNKIDNFKAKYGTDNKYIDVSDIVIRTLVKDQTVFIPRNYNFTENFGYLNRELANTRKKLMITINGYTRNINEHRSYDIKLKI